MFVPQAGLTAGGGIHPDGTYRVFTKCPFDGAVIGRHKVCVIPPLQPRTAGYPQFDSKYQSPEMSGLKFDVKAGQNVFDIDLSD